MASPVARDVTDNQNAWEAACPAAIVRDPLWKLRAYRAALYLVHCATEDAELLRGKSRFAVADQLQRAAASVAANLSEGYGRNGRADRLKFLDYALGSARECIAWYESARGVITREALERRHELLSRLRGLLFGLIRSLRSRSGAPQFKR